MKLRSLKTFAVGLCLLVALASAYHVGAAPPPPTKGAAYAGEPFVVSGAEMALPPRASRSVASTAVAPMREDFEGVWPAAGWDLADRSSADGGEHLWGKRDCHPRAGAYGAWAVGGGAQGSQLGCSADYPNNILTWARYGPFDLSEASSARLTYHFWGQVEGAQGCPFDQFFVGSAIDGSQFSGTLRCGNWTNGPAGNGYNQGTLDLSNRVGQAQVWVAFALGSDATIAASGITIDDISLEVDAEAASTTTASPTRTATPIATSGPIMSPTSPQQAPVPGTPLYLPYVTRPRQPTQTPTMTPTRTPSPTASPTGTATSTPDPDSFPIDGSWEGTTSQGLPLFFDVANRSFTSFAAGYATPGCARFIIQSFTPPKSITGNTFSVSIAAPGDFILIEGTFSDSDSASGTLEAQGTCGSVNATWTATKQ